MKLAPVLSSYFHTHNELHLVGIGSFFKDSKGALEEDAKGKHRQSGHISFERNLSKNHNAALVEYISSETGKMKTLAEADLDSYLEQAIQFLNIGKPVVLEDIGTLVKNADGSLRFIPYNEIEKYRDPASIDATTTIATEESFGPYQDKSLNKGSNWQKPVAFILLTGGIVFAIWAGYWLYRQSANTATPAVQVATPEAIIPVEDSISVPPATDTVPSVETRNDGYKFVLETSNRNRAMTRYEQLKSYRWNVMMETTDSVNFQIYIPLNVPATDTLRIKDSLTRLTGRPVSIR